MVLDPQPLEESAIRTIITVIVGDMITLVRKLVYAEGLLVFNSTSRLCRFGLIAEVHV